jgi:hypothetical protein
MMLALFLIAAPQADVNPPRVNHEPPTAADANGHWRLWFEVRDESELFGAAMYVAASDGSWRTLKPQKVAPGWFEVVLPVQEQARYFFEVFDVLGNGPTRVGTDEVPFVLKPPSGVLGKARPWDAPPPVAVVEPVTPWWLQRPSDQVLWGATAVVGASLAAYAGWALLRNRPVSKVVLVPTIGSVTP